MICNGPLDGGHEVVFFDNLKKTSPISILSVCLNFECTFTEGRIIIRHNVSFSSEYSQFLDKMFRMYSR